MLTHLPKILKIKNVLIPNNKPPAFFSPPKPSSSSKQNTQVTIPLKTKTKRSCEGEERSGKCDKCVISLLTKDKPLVHLVPLQTTQT